MTVGELKRALSLIRDDIEIVSCGADCGGYDVEDGFNIAVNLFHGIVGGRTEKQDYVYIRHFSDGE